jgi:hypothetical protein
LIPLLVSGYFRFPIIPVGPRQVPAARTPVEKASINEDHDTFPFDYEVGFTGDVARL